MKTKRKKAKPRTRRRYKGGWGNVFTSKWWSSVSETMRTPRQSHTEGYGPQSEIARECREDDSQDCLLFGTQIKNVLSFFNNFNLDATGPIRVQWEAFAGAAASDNGFVSLVKFTRDNVHALAVLKTSKKKKSDNLMYEYRVGTYLNSVCDIFPCFVFTYGIYTGLKPPKTAQPVAIAPENIVSDYSINAACDPVRGVEKLNLLTQFLANSKPLYSYMKQKNDALLPVFFQIVYSLVWLNSGGKYVFQHNDLHANNVLIYELPKPIQFSFQMRDSEPVVFSSRYLAKIIDYGRAKYGLDEPSTAHDLKEHAAAANCNHTKDRVRTPVFSKTGDPIGFYFKPTGALNNIFFKTKDLYYAQVSYIQDVPEKGKLYYYNERVTKYTPIDGDDARSLYDETGTLITGNNVDGFATIVLSDLIKKSDFHFCQDYMKRYHQWEPTSENPLEHLMGFLAPLVHKPTKPWKWVGTLTVRGPTLEPMVFDRVVLSENPCTIAQNCLLFGMQLQRVLSFFNNFNLDKPVPGQTIQWKALQTSGGNADVCVVKYTRDQHDAFALLKKAKSAKLDNLMYEYRVGTFLNAVCSLLPCFVYTYGLYTGIKFPTAGDFVKMSPIGPKNVVVDYSMAAACGARDSAGNAPLCLLTQYLEGSVVLDDFFRTATREKRADPMAALKWNKFFFPIFFQIAYSLVYLNKKYYFRHNDLHPSNILVYELPYPIEFTFVMESQPHVVFCTKYLAKIIDYGRASYESEAWRRLTVPPDARPGQVFDLPLRGKTYPVKIPEGAKPGEIFMLRNPEVAVPPSTQTDFTEHQAASKRRNQNDKRTYLCNEYNLAQYDDGGFLKGGIYKRDAAEHLTRLEASYHVTGRLSGLMLKNQRSKTFENIEDTQELYSLLQTPQFENGIFGWQAEPEKQFRRANDRLVEAKKAAKLTEEALTRAGKLPAEFIREALDKGKRASDELKRATDEYELARSNRKTEKVLEFGEKLYFADGQIIPSKPITMDGFEAIFMQYYSKNDVSFCKDYLGDSKFKNMDDLLEFLVTKMEEPDPAERLFGTLLVDGPQMKPMVFVKDGDDFF